MKNCLCLSVSALLWVGQLLHAELPPNWPADYPAWWYQPDNPADGVIDATITPLNQNNDALLNEGQLWNLAEQGIAELDKSLAPLGGAGFSLDALRDPSNPPAYLSPALIGQLKNVSAQFFDRFAAVGFAPGSPGWPAGLSLDPATGYPWAQNQTPTNLAPANLGQAKHLFAWDPAPWITSAMAADSDGDGLPDFWENYWGTLAMSPSGDYDGDGLSNLGEYLAGSDPTAEDYDPPILRAPLRGNGNLVIHLLDFGYHSVVESTDKSTLDPL